MEYKHQIYQQAKYSFDNYQPLIFTYMKKISLLLLLFSVTVMLAQETKTSVFSKKNEIKIGGIKLLSGTILEGTYEYIHSKDFTYGSSILVNMDTANDYDEDFSITPFARFYFQETKEYGAQGFFVEGFAKYVNGKRSIGHYDALYNYYETKETFDASALGLSLGKKWINRSGFVFEILVGAGRTLGNQDNVPDAFFRGDLFVGYRF